MFQVNNILYTFQEVASRKKKKLLGREPGYTMYPVGRISKLAYVVPVYTLSTENTTYAFFMKTTQARAYSRQSVQSIVYSRQSVQSIAYTRQSVQQYSLQSTAVSQYSIQSTAVSQYSLQLMAVQSVAFIMLGITN